MFCNKSSDLVNNQENLDSNRILIDKSSKNGVKPSKAISKLRTKVKCKNLTSSSSTSSSSSSSSSQVSLSPPSSPASKSNDYRPNRVDNHSGNVRGRKCSGMKNNHSNKNPLPSSASSNSNSNTNNSVSMSKNQKSKCSRAGGGMSVDGSGTGSSGVGGGDDPTCNSLLCSYCCCCCRRRRCNCRCHAAAATAAAAANHCLHHFLTDPQNNSQVSMEEALRWKTSFEKLMNNDVGRKIFQEFLRFEYSEENIEFWLACENLKKVSATDPQLREKIQLIYDEFVSVQSSREVSLDSKVREIINRNMQSAETLSPNIFNEAQTQIYTLMHRDSYPRFLNSFFYKSIFNANDNERDNPSDRNDNDGEENAVATDKADDNADNANDGDVAVVVDNAHNKQSSNQNNVNNNNGNDMKTAKTKLT